MSDRLQGGVKAGATSVSLSCVLRKTVDSTEQTGKVAADMTVSYIRQGGTLTSVTPLSDLAAVNSAFSAGGVKEIGSGAYRLDLPDAAFAAGADWIQFMVTVAGCFVYHERVPITSNVIQTGDTYARLGAPAGASVSADVAAIKSDTGTTLTDAVAIKAKTDNLPAAPADETLIIAATNSLSSKLGTPAGASIAADIAAVKSDTGATLTDATAIKAKTDNLPASPAAVGSAMTLTTGERTAVADALLDRDMSAGTDSGSPTVRTMRQALRFLRNKWAIATGTLTVFKEDDTTASWTASVTTTAGADPVTGNDPA